MKALLFAAGLGTRLRPITDKLPKALVPVSGKPLLQWNIEHLCRFGVDFIVINTHYLAAQIRDFVASRSWDAEIVISDESEELLDTGGGLLHAATHLRGEAPFFMYNADILCSINLEKLYQQHQDSQALATLAVRNRAGSRQLLWENGRLCGWVNHNKNDLRMAYAPAQSPIEWAFSGIHVASPALLDLIPQRGVFSIIDSYLSLAAQQPILAYLHDADKWVDVGTPEKLAVCTWA